MRSFSLSSRVWRAIALRFKPQNQQQAAKNQMQTFSKSLAFRRDQSPAVAHILLGRRVHQQHRLQDRPRSLLEQLPLPLPTGRGPVRRKQVYESRATVRDLSITASRQRAVGKGIPNPRSLSPSCQKQCRRIARVEDGGEACFLRRALL